MLEGLVAWVLNNYLGKYVENLNTDQLSIALLSGEVELENLPLKKDALKHIGLPIEIKAGFIGKVRLQVPVRQIRTASWVIAIEQLYLVAGPINLDEYDSEAEEQIFQEYKLSRLDALEARWRASNERDVGYYASSYSSWLNYGTSLVTNIIENLQLNIRNVHLRYEDDVTLGDGSGVALGITIKSLTAQSCDSTWTPGSTSWNVSDASFKLMELDGLSIYWNHLNVDQVFGRLTLGDLAIAMSESKNTKWNYILFPVSAQAHIKRDRSEKPLRSISQPRIIVNLQLDQVPLSLTDEQYEQMVTCIRELENIDHRRRQWRCRPSMSVTLAPKEWWKYAARCHLGKDTLKPKMSWNDVIQRSHDNVVYVEAIRKLLDTPTAILSPDIKSIKEKIEYERSFDDLRMLREIAMSKVRPPKPIQETPAPVSPAARGMLVQWFPQWWGWYSKAPANSQSTSSTFDGELLDVLADTIDDNTLLRRDTVFGQFNFTLSKGAISLCASQKNIDVKKTVMELQFERVNLSYESRPRSGSHKFSISLGALYLHDFLTENSMLPILIQPQTISGPSSSRLRTSSEKLVVQQPVQPLFELIYEKKPFHANTDHALHLSTRSLDVVYNPTAIKWLIDFISNPHKNSSAHRLQAMKKKTRRQLIKNWEQILEGDFVYRSSWDLQFNISAPQILLVEKFQDSNAAVIVVDFGKLHLTNNIGNKKVILRPGSPNSDDDFSDMNSKNLKKQKEQENEDDDDDDESERFQTPCSTPPGSQENESIVEYQGISETALHHKLYDQYSIDLFDLQILVGKIKDNWKHARTRGMSSLHVLERFNISLQIERRIVSTMDPQYPSLTISGNLPRLVVH